MDHAKIETIDGNFGPLRRARGGVAQHPLLSWRAIFAGLLISLFTYVLLVALGVGVGGISLSNGLEAGVEAAGYWTAGWIFAANALALFVGAFFAARIARSPARLVGATQAIVIAALFFGVVSLQAAASLGVASQALGTLVGNGDEAMTHSIAVAPEIQDIMDESFLDLNLELPPEEVSKGVAIRLLTGETARARDYLARYAGITPEDAQPRIERAKAQTDAAIAKMRESAAKTLASAGLALFTILFLGALSGVFGGVVGARRNLRLPIHDEEIVAVDRAA